MPLPAAIVILSMMCAVASGAVQINKAVDLSALKHGQPVYTVNK